MNEQESLSNLIIYKFNAQKSNKFFFELAKRNILEYNPKHLNIFKNDIDMKFKFIMGFILS